MPDAFARSRKRDRFPTVPVALTGALAVTIGLPTAAVAHEVEPTRDLPQLASLTERSGVVSAAKSLPTAAAGRADHTVSLGETVTAIAIANGLRTVDVLAWNKLSWADKIYPGQSIRLTAPSSATPRAAAPAQEAPVGQATELRHTVVSGDTVSAIAGRYGVSTQRVLDLNDLESSAIIYPGQELLVATNKLESVAPIEPVPDEAPQEEAPQAEPEIPQPDETPDDTSGTTHTVESGDTLWAIAQKYGVSLSELLAANGLSSDSIIYPGQELKIPNGGSTPAPQEVPDDEPQGDEEAPPSIYDSPKDQLHASLNAPQLENAAMIAQIGRELGVSDRGIAIALATAMVESGIRNLDWGDRDSLGLFQQRPSTGWGTEEQILDRNHSIRAFYGGPNDPNGHRTRGLLDIPGWEQMGFGEAAQTVQISAFPNRYARWEQAAYGWLAQVS